MKKVIVWTNIHVPDCRKASAQHLGRCLRNLKIWISEWSQAPGSPHQLTVWLTSSYCCVNTKTCGRKTTHSSERKYEVVVLYLARRVDPKWAKIHPTSAGLFLLQFISLLGHSSFIHYTLNCFAQTAGGCHRISRMRPCRLLSIGNWGPERLGDLPMITQQPNGKQD